VQLFLSALDAGAGVPTAIVLQETYARAGLIGLLLLFSCATHETFMTARIPERLVSGAGRGRQRRAPQALPIALRRAAAALRLPRLRPACLLLLDGRRAVRELVSYDQTIIHKHPRVSLQRVSAIHGIV